MNSSRHTLLLRTARSVVLLLCLHTSLSAQLFPERKLRIRHSLGSGFYAEFEGGIVLLDQRREAWHGINIGMHIVCRDDVHVVLLLALYLATRHHGEKCK